MKTDVAAEVWRLMARFAFAKLQGSHHVGLLRAEGLTPGHMRALSLLDPEQPRPMRAMAEALACDASMVTALVDRLEEKGLVRRRPSDEDRRVKILVLTPRGVDLRRRLGEALFSPPRELLDLDLASLTALRDELRKLPAPDAPLWPSADEARREARPG